MGKRRSPKGQERKPVGSVNRRAATGSPCNCDTLLRRLRPATLSVFPMQQKLRKKGKPTERGGAGRQMRSICVNPTAHGVLHQLRLLTPLDSA